MRFIKVFLLLCMTSFSYGQSTTMATFDKDESGTHLYFYQSVLRLLNLDKNPDFDRLIKDLEYLKFVMVTPEILVSKKYNALLSQLSNEGYEELMSFDRKNYVSIIMENENKGISNWMVLFMMDDNVGLIEMNGSLDPKYFTAFSSFDFEKLESFIPNSTKDN